MLGKRELEICVETLQACHAAFEGGADRIELCSALAEGGVTPSLGFLREAISAVSLPIHVLLRPRTANFLYSDAEFRVLCRDAESALAAGASGLVAGMLTAHQTVDAPRMKRLLHLSHGCPVTFHRAFDQTHDLAGSLEVLIDLGCARVLTSGGRPTVMEGRATLGKLTAQGAGRIRIAAGGGVTLDNASHFTAIQGLDLHASLRGKPEPSGGDPLWSAPSGDLPVEAVRTLSRIVQADDQSGSAKAT